MADNKTFTLIGKFDDQISKKLKEVNKLFTDIQKSTQSFGSEINGVSKSIGKMTSSLEDAGRAAGKVRDTVSQIGEGVKGLDGISESLEAAARAAGRAQDEVSGIGEAASRANRQADDLMNTLLKAEGLSRFGDAMAQGLNRGMNVVMGTVQKGAGLTAKLFKDAMDDELADIKAASGIQGSFALAGFKGDFRESERMYKKYDQVVSEMIRQSSAPTAKVVELQRYTLDTMGPLMLAAQGVKKGTAMKDIDPKKIQASATQYGQFLEKAALFSQGTGSAGFRVAAGIEGLVTRGKIDTTIDFFTDNIMLMKNLEAAGFAGRGMRSSKLMNATDAQRMAAMMEAFNKSMSGESTKAMAASLTGSLQGLQDTIFNPSVGILGMSVTFSKEEQKKANESIRRIQNERIAGYTQELNNVKTSEARKKQLRINIEQAEITRDQLVKDDVISTPFKAFSYAFSNIVRKLTEALNAIGPIWTNFAVAAIEITNKVFGPLGETLGNVASDMRGKKVTQAEGFGRIFGELFKTAGEIMGDLAKMITDPNSAMGKVQSEFMKGFMAAFKEPGSLKAAQEGIKKGISALIGKLFEFMWTAITFEPIRPLVLLFIAGIFGPPLIAAVVAGATPLIINAFGKMALGLLRGGKIPPAGGAAGGSILRTLLGGASSQFGKAGEAAKAIPGVKGAQALASGAKMKGLGVLAAGAVTLATNSAALKKAGDALMGIGKRIPFLSVALAGLDFGVRKAAGQGTGQAGGSAVGGVVGGGIGAAIGSAILPGVGTLAGGVLGSWLGSWLGEEVGKAIDSMKVSLSPGSMSRGLDTVKNWFLTLPETVGGWLGATWSRLSNWFSTEIPRLGEWAFSKLGTFKNRIQQGLNQFFSDAQGKLSDPSRWGSLVVSLVQGLQNAINNVNPMTLVTAGFNAGRNLAGRFVEAFRTGATVQDSRNAPPARTNKQTWAQMRYDGIPKASVPLGRAIASEMRNKPTGSDLVIANSSETIIPAARGNSGSGLLEFIETFRSGLSAVATTVRVSGDLLRNTTHQSMNSLKLAFNQANQAQQTNLTKINQTLVSNQLQTNARMAKLEAKFSLPGAGSLGGGAAAGGVEAFTPMASLFGLTKTSGYRAGDPGYHGVNRARDYSNSTGPTPQMLRFARYMAARYGQNLKELIYTPLGYSIKNGRVVPPYARAAHYNHVHVAYAGGPGNPAIFGNQRDAIRWEKKATLGNVKVSSITSNSSEGMGGATTINAPITINQQPGQSSEHLAALVAMELSNAIRQARSSSMYV